MESNDTFRIEMQKDAVVITPLINLRELDYGRIEEDGRTVIRQLADEKAKHVVLDFSNIDYFGTTALGFFVTLWKRLRARGGNMAFCNVSPHEREILRVTRIDTLWDICETREEAISTVHPEHEGD